MAKDSRSLTEVNRNLPLFPFQTSFGAHVGDEFLMDNDVVASEAKENAVASVQPIDQIERGLMHHHHGPALRTDPLLFVKARRLRGRMLA